MTEPPLLAHALPGFRTWMLDPTGALVPYTGVTGPWTAGVNTARCGRGARHESPAGGCTCGIYAFHDLHQQLRGEPFVGAIAAWGEMEVYRDGFRAQHATVLALSGAPGPALLRAAERYAVPIVPRRTLQPLARLLTGALPPGLVELPAGGAPGWLARRRGFAPEHQVWAEAQAGLVTLGVSAALREWLGDAVEVVAASPRADRHVPLRLRSTQGEVELPQLVRGRVEALNRAPAPAAADPEGGCWVARLHPSDWEDDCRAFAWGASARQAMLAETARSGAAAWEHLLGDAAGDAAGISSWRDVRAMLDALREQPPPPRFASADEVYDELAIPLGQALGRDRSLTRLDLVLAFSLSDPDARLVLDLRREHGALHATRGPVADIDVSLSADDLVALLEGRLDLARESRSGRLRIRGSLAHALSCLAILRTWTRPHLAGVLSPAIG